MLIPPENDVPIMLTLKSLESTNEDADGDRPSPFQGITLMFQRVCCCKFHLFALPPLPVALMTIASLSKRWYANSHHGSKVSLPPFIPKPPVDDKRRKREREEKEAARAKRIASRRAAGAAPAPAPTPAVSASESD